jgi:hypothetical protein
MLLLFDVSHKASAVSRSIDSPVLFDRVASFIGGPVTAKTKFVSQVFKALRFSAENARQAPKFIEVRQQLQSDGWKVPGVTEG